MNYNTIDAHRHMGIESPSIPTKFYVLITLEDAFGRWRESGKQITFGLSVKVLEMLGYKVI